MGPGCRMQIYRIASKPERLYFCWVFHWLTTFRWKNMWRHLWSTISKDSNQKYNFTNHVLELFFQLFKHLKLSSNSDIPGTYLRFLPWFIVPFLPPLVLNTNWTTNHFYRFWNQTFFWPFSYRFTFSEYVFAYLLCGINAQQVIKAYLDKLHSWTI